MVKIISLVYKNYRQHNCNVMAAGLAYFGMLALVPVLIIGLSAMGYMLGSSEEAHQFITKLLAEHFPESAAGFKITEQSLENLKTEGVPDDVLKKLQILKNQKVTGEEEFLGVLRGTIGDEQTDRFKSLILKHAESAVNLVKKIDALIAAPGRHFTEGLGLAGLIWAALRFFSLLERVLSSIWVGATRRKFIHRKSVPIIAFCLAGALFWLSFIYYSVISMTKGLELPLPSSISAYDLHWLWQTFRMGSLFITSVVIFYLIYDFMPGSEVSSRAAFTGALFAGLFWEMSKLAFNWAMKQFNVYSRTYEPLYGPLAALILLMLWVYISMIVLLLGAEIGSAYQEMKSEK